jgi:hypothetical protein
VLSDKNNMAQQLFFLLNFLTPIRHSLFDEN